MIAERSDRMSVDRDGFMPQVVAGSAKEAPLSEEAPSWRWRQRWRPMRGAPPRRGEA